jgi:hypothetical protein
MSRPEDALIDLAERLRSEESVISPHVRDQADPRALPEPVHGLLAAAGPRAAAAPADYALLVEAVREGYLLHYGHARLLVDIDRDLALLAGDYLYALGLERLAALGDLDAVRELADLISLAAQLGAEGSGRAAAEALWAAAVVAIASGAGDEHENAKAALRRGDADAPRMLMKVATDTGSRTGLDDRLEGVADAIDFDAGGTV